MPENKEELRAFEVSYRCDRADCLGDMKHTGIVLYVAAPLYEHRCSICGVTTNMSKKYPCIEYSLMGNH